MSASESKPMPETTVERLRECADWLARQVADAFGMSIARTLHYDMAARCAPLLRESADRIAQLEAELAAAKQALGKMQLRDQHAAWNWLDCDGQERADDAIIHITDARGKTIATANGAWLKAASLFPPSDELPDHPPEPYRTIHSLERRIIELEEERDKALYRSP